MPLPLSLPVMKFLQDEVDHENPVQRRIPQLIEAHQIIESLLEKVQKYQSKVKFVFDKRENQQLFQENDLVLCWDARREDHGNHGKFENLWFGPFKIVEVLENNTFLLKHLDDDQLTRGPINGHFLKWFFIY